MELWTGRICGAMLVVCVGACQAFVLQVMWYVGKLPFAIGFSAGCVGGVVMLGAVLADKPKRS